MLTLPLEIDGRAPSGGHVDAFLAAGGVSVQGGSVGLAGDALALRDRLLGEFALLGAALGADAREYPVLIGADLLARTDYFLSFPHQVTAAAPVEEAGLPAFVAAVRGGERPGPALQRHLAAPGHVLQPAVCYHCYAELAGVAIRAPFRALSATGRCFRREADDSCRPLARQREFTMHEIVILGEAAAVSETRHRVLDRVVGLARRIGFRGRVEQAYDPFYRTLEGRARRVLQEAGQLKLELLVGDGEEQLAIASFNLHEDYFGRAFGIGLAGTRAPAHSACVAFGVERWMRAVVAARGPRPEDWRWEGP